MIEKNKKPKKVTVLTGFLGAGKTTVLNAILQNKAKTRFAIIENEVGEIGIDAELIVKNTDSFTELNNGCICCSINKDFNDTLKKLSQRDDWDELIIEATGIADPGGILSPFLTFPWIQKYFQAPEVICIVDGQNITEQLEVSDTAASQLAYSDKIFFNKMDLVTKEQLNERTLLIKQFNPITNILSGSKRDIPIKALLQTEESEDTFQNLEKRNKELKRHHGHGHFEAVSLEYDKSFNENKLYIRLYSHLTMSTRRPYRIKGIFFDARNSSKVIIQSAMKSLYTENGGIWEKEEPRISKFVFIGKNLNHEELDELLRSCQ